MPLDAREEAEAVSLRQGAPGLSRPHDHGQPARGHEDDAGPSSAIFGPWLKDKGARILLRFFSQMIKLSRLVLGWVDADFLQPNAHVAGSFRDLQDLQTFALLDIENLSKISSNSVCFDF